MFKVGDKVKMAEPVDGKWLTIRQTSIDFSDWKRAYDDKRVGKITHNFEGTLSVTWYTDATCKEMLHSSGCLSEYSLVPLYKIKIYKYKGEEYV